MEMEVTNWNFDMSQAPRGSLVTIDRQIGKNTATIEQHVPDLIIAAGRDGKTVTVSRWLPEADRWNMFSKAHPPIAWMPFPKHPEAEA